MPDSGRDDDMFRLFEAHFARQDEFNARFDRHLERQNAINERIERHMTRQERAQGHVLGVLTAIRDSLDDMRGEIRAQTEAIWRVIDRLDEGGAPGNA